MARRRINTKFLAIAVAPVVVLICMAGAYVMFPGFRQITPIRQLRHVTWLWRGTPAQHRDKGKALMDKGDYKKAAEEYKQAIQLMGNIDPEMYTALGDCFTHLVLDDPDNLKRAQVCWSQSVAMDPRYLPAQQRLLQAYIDDAEINGGGRSAQQWGAVYDAATRVMLIDPNDRGAKIAADRALIERTVLGVETDQQRVDAAAADLNDLLKQPPFNADILLYLAELKVSRSDDAARQGDRTTADQGLSDAKKLLEDTIVAHPDDWRTHYRTAQIYRMIGISERAGGSGLKSFARATEEYKKAAALIKLDDPLNGEVRGSLANFLQETGHRIDAVKILRQVLADHPDNMPARLQLAQMLGSNEKERHEAIDLLQHIPDPNPNDWIGVKAMLVRGYELTMLSTLVDFKLDALGEAKDQAEYQADLKEIDDDYAKLTATRGVSDTSIGLELAGRIQMAKGENVDAVQTLDRAIKLATAPANVNDVQRRYKLMFILARAYLNVNQTGEAKLLLTAIVHDVGDFVPARFMLTQILLREGNIDEARKHMDVLVKAMPGTPIAMRLTILSLDKDKDKAKINELYNQLPESNVEEMSDKVQVAMYLGWNDQAVKLLETIYAGNPHNDNTVLALARLYVQQGNSSKANALISDAIAKNPDHTNLKVLQAEVAGTNVGEVRRDLVEKMTDPLQKELGLFQLAMQENHPDEAATHLQAAAKIKPDDSRVLVYEFTDAIHRKDWDKATTYADALAKLNVDNADGALYRIQLARAKGDLDSAADLAQQLVLKMPEFAQSWISLGQV
ncbi:MAG TPA: tetratricopeptide repeat protein, partial [Tepidisphaeraceae bacterium]|nr:tetratricopeptide repeat protein [Tepidisphaeraceae bacterium]